MSSILPGIYDEQLVQYFDVKKEESDKNVQIIPVDDLVKVIDERLLNDKVDLASFSKKQEWNVYEDFQELNRYSQPPFYKQINL